MLRGALKVKSVFFYRSILFDLLILTIFLSDNPENIKETRRQSRINRELERKYLLCSL